VATPASRFGPFTQLLVDLAADQELLNRWLESEDERERIMNERGLSEEQKDLLRQGDLHGIHREIHREHESMPVEPGAPPTVVPMVVMYRIMWG
jgi:hypothetical protein